MEEKKKVVMRKIKSDKVKTKIVKRKTKASSVKKESAEHLIRTTSKYSKKLLRYLKINKFRQILDNIDNNFLDYRKELLDLISKIHEHASKDWLGFSHVIGVKNREEYYGFAAVDKKFIPDLIRMVENVAEHVNEDWKGFSHVVGGIYEDWEAEGHVVRVGFATEVGAKFVPRLVKMVENAAEYASKDWKGFSRVIGCYYKRDVMRWGFSALIHTRWDEDIVSAVAGMVENKKVAEHASKDWKRFSNVIGFDDCHTRCGFVAAVITDKKLVPELVKLVENVAEEASENWIEFSYVVGCFDPSNKCWGFASELNMRIVPNLVEMIKNIAKHASKDWIGFSQVVGLKKRNKRDQKLLIGFVSVYVEEGFLQLVKMVENVAEEASEDWKGFSQVIGYRREGFFDENPRGFAAIGLSDIPALVAEVEKDKKELSKEWKGFAKRVGQRNKD